MFIVIKHGLMCSVVVTDNLSCDILSASTVLAIQPKLDWTREIHFRFINRSSPVTPEDNIVVLEKNIGNRLSAWINGYLDAKAKLLQAHLRMHF